MGNVPTPEGGDGRDLSQQERRRIVALMEIVDDVNRVSDGLSKLREDFAAHVADGHGSAS